MNTNFRLFIFLAGLVTPITAHTQPKSLKCPDTVVINSFITTYGFGYKDLDTVLIKTFIKNSGFKKAIDSFYVYSKDVVADSINIIRYIDIGETKQITNAIDWEIRMKHNTVFKINNVKTAIVLERHQFNRCKLVGYTLNGVTHKAESIEIIKHGFKIKKLAAPKKLIKDRDRNRDRMIL